jgi:hypothetical protein
MRKVLPALAAAFTASCGYMGTPLPPLANIPSKVNDLSAIQQGDRILARFTIPMLTTEGVALKKGWMLDFRIGPPASSNREDLWAASAMPVTGGVIEKGTALYEIPTSAWVNQTAVIGVRIIGENGKESGWSNLVAVPVVPPPETPTDVRAVATAEGVQLSWQARGMDFRIFRRTGTEMFAVVADTPQAPWTDNMTQYGQTYTYHVQTIVKLADNREAQSDPSADVSITPVDKFPPIVPKGVRATASPNTIEVSWDPDTDPDLAGYRVYRAEGGGAFVKVADTSTIPTYSDHAVEHGKTYRYAVSAVDQAGNESARSAPVETTLE